MRGVSNKSVCDETGELFKCCYKPVTSRYLVEFRGALFPKYVLATMNGCNTEYPLTFGGTSNVKHAIYQNVI